MANSPSDAGAQHLHPTEYDSQLSSIVYDMSQQVQTAMENMLKKINEIDQSSTAIAEDIEKCKFSALERKTSLEDQKDMIEKAAYSVVEMLNKRINIW